MRKERKIDLFWMRFSFFLVSDELDSEYLEELSLMLLLVFFKLC